MPPPASPKCNLRILYANKILCRIWGRCPLGRWGLLAGYNLSMPVKRSNPKTMHRAGELRRESTPAESKLWAYLRGNKIQGVSFRRQHAIGNYIVDFVSIKQNLIIELDGSQHLEQEEHDEERTRYFQSVGYRVVRFWNNAVMNDMDGVIREIELTLLGK